MAANEAGDRTVDPQQRAHYLLAAHYAECPIDGVRVDDGCGAATCEANHVCETVVYSLTPVADCPPGLPDCREPLFPWRECIGNDGRPVAEPLPTALPYGAPAHDRGPQDRLCAWSEDWLASSDPSRASRPLQIPRAMPGRGAPGRSRCRRSARLRDDRIPLRRGVHRRGRRNLPARGASRARTTALFDLIRGCDLVRIQDVGWSAWLKPPFSSSFGEFARMFQRPPPRRGREPREPADTGFWVCFSGPVQVASLTPDVFTMTLIQRDTNEAVGNMVRVPITGAGDRADERRRSARNDPLFPPAGELAFLGRRDQHRGRLRLRPRDTRRDRGPHATSSSITWGRWLPAAGASRRVAAPSREDGSSPRSRWFPTRIGRQSRSRSNPMPEEA